MVAIANANADAAESVGSLGMRVKAGEMTPEAAERWARRVEILAQWLLGMWLREQVGGQ
jgi:hypothetical protein